MRSAAKLANPLRTHFSVRVLLLFVLALVLAALATTSAQKFVAGDSFATRGKRVTTAGPAKVANTPTSTTITSISPSQGPIAGGTQVTLTGSGFTGTTLTLDGKTITPQSASDTQIVFITPAHDNGIGSVKISGNGPNAYAEFLYLPPSLQSLPAGYITTVMGIGFFRGDGRPATNAMVEAGVAGLAIDKDGLLYIDEPNQNTIRRVRSDGVIERYAGTGPNSGPSIDGIPALQSILSHPRGVDVDSSGNVYLADSIGLNSVREIDAKTGIINTIAGGPTSGFSGDGGLASQAKLNDPLQLAFDDAGNLYVLDWGNVRIRKIDIKGIITTIAGTGVAGFSGDGGPATQATFDIGEDDEGGLAADGQGNVFLADHQNGRVRRIDGKTGLITTFVVGVGPVNAVATDSSGNVYVGDNNNSGSESRILKVSPAGQLVRTWGKGTGFTQDGAIVADVPLGNISRIRIDASGNIIFAEYDSSRIRRINVASGVLDTIAGMGPRIIGESGPALATVLNAVGTDFVFLPTGEMLTAEGGNFLVRKVDLQGNVTKFAGSGFIVFLPTPTEAPALQTWLLPQGVAFAPNGNVFIVNDDGAAILRVDPQGNLFTVTSNSGGFSGDGGPAGLAALNTPSQAAIDSGGNLFIADTGNNRIRRIDGQSGVITTVAGNGSARECGDSSPATLACLNTPYGVAVDSDGTIYIGDADQRIRKVTPSGVISTLYSGAPSNGNYVKLNPAHNVFTPLDCRIEPNGHAYCPFMRFGITGLGDGGPVNLAKQGGNTLLGGIAVDAEGNLFFSDGVNHRIRAIRFGAVIAEPGSIVSATSGTPQTTPAGTSFPVPLQVTVKSPAGTLENGIRVDFSAPSSGASCTFPNGNSTYSVLTDINGHASATCTANSQIGSYAVTATPLALRQSASFSLSNATPPTIQFSSASYVVTEGTPSVDISLTRTGITSSAATVRFVTSDGTAKEGRDYTAAYGVLNFAPGETSKSITVLIIDNGFVDGSRTVNLAVTNPSAATLGAQSTAMLTINDNDTSPGTINPIDQARFFVQLHYYDFLSRYPDQGGWDFWTNNINNCAPRPSCTDIQRINTSAAYFLSIEFQQTGYLIERIYKAAYGEASGNSTFNGAHQLAVPIVRFNEFLPDTQEIGNGVIVGQTGWETVLENNKQAFTNEFVQRSRFTTAFPTTMTPAQFVDKLFANAVVVPSATDRNAAINEFGSATNTADTAARARALRRVAENATLNTQEFNRAFVLMQFFGYLRRDPNSSPDTDYTGYDFWLSKLNQFNGNFVSAEMVKAFITSSEYRQRFGP